jgi:hypothetical protein
MPLLRSQLRSEPEELNVASGVVARRRSGVAGRIRRGGRQNAYATLCANFLGCSASSYSRPMAAILTPLPGTALPQEPPLLPRGAPRQAGRLLAAGQGLEPRKAESYSGQVYADRKRWRGK